MSYLGTFKTNPSKKKKIGGKVFWNVVLEIKM